MKRLRFSLRTLLLVMTLFAGGCYWLVLPSLNAGRFVRAIKAENFAVADELFIEPNDRFLARWNDECAAFRAKAALVPWSIRQVTAGERQILANFVYGRPGLMNHYECKITATRAGVRAPQVQRFGGGSMTIAARHAARQ